MHVIPKLGEYLVRCQDGVIRWAPVGLADELERVFRHEEVVARGPVVAFSNGVKIRLIDVPPGGQLISMIDLPHIVLSGPEPGMQDIPPIVHMPDGAKSPPRNAILLMDTAVAGSENLAASWVIRWPGFEPETGKQVIKAVLTILKIPVRVRVQADEGRAGCWRIFRNGHSELAKGNPHVAGRRLRGSQYPWADLKEEEPYRLHGTSTVNLLNNFTAWARRRNIRWRVKFRSKEPGIIEATRQGVGSYFEKPLNDK